MHQTGLRSSVPDCTEQALDLSELYRRYAGLVRKRILRFVAPSEADDVLQDVFERAVAKASTFRGDSSPLPWLLRLATRHCLNDKRNRARRLELLEEQGGSLSWSATVAPADQYAVAALSRAWRSLDEESLSLAVYYYLDGMTHAQIAQRTGISRRTVCNRLLGVERQLGAISGGDT